MDTKLLEDGLDDVYHGVKKLADAFGLDEGNQDELLDITCKFLADHCVSLLAEQKGSGALRSAKRTLIQRRDELVENIIRERNEK